MQATCYCTSLLLGCLLHSCSHSTCHRAIMKQDNSTFKCDIHYINASQWFSMDAQFLSCSSQIGPSPNGEALLNMLTCPPLPKTKSPSSAVYIPHCDTGTSDHGWTPTVDTDQVCAIKTSSQKLLQIITKNNLTAGTRNFSCLAQRTILMVNVDWRFIQMPYYHDNVSSQNVLYNIV